jgi:hypothetical protein
MENLTLQEMNRVDKKVNFLSLFEKDFILKKSIVFSDSNEENIEKNFI